MGRGENFLFWVGQRFLLSNCNGTPFLKRRGKLESAGVRGTYTYSTCVHTRTKQEEDAAMSANLVLAGREERGERFQP